MSTFFEVLPELVVDKKLISRFKDAQVLEVEFKKQIQSLVFKLESKVIIGFNEKIQMQEQIKYKLFFKSNIKIILEIKYIDIDQSIEEITTQHKNSIMKQIKNESILIFLLLQNTDWEVNDYTIIINSMPNPLALSQFKEIEKYLKKVYMSFGKQIECKLKFIEGIQQDYSQSLKKEISQTILKNYSSEPAIPTPTENTKKKDTTKKLSDPTLIMGKNCDGKVFPIVDITEELGELVIEGQIINFETREIRSEKTILIFDITDFTDTITCKIFVKNEELSYMLENVCKGKFYRIKGMAALDKFDREIAIGGIKSIKLISDFRAAREDRAEKKRIELHLHTVMSDMDSVVNIKQVIERAKSWGMPALAITDHGCIQAFPIANHCVKKDEPFKIIYGVEAYFVDDIEPLTEDYARSLKTYHGIILVQNEIGRINLNKLVSISHLEYFKRRPRIPKSIINKYREGLIIGSACEAGELFQAILEEKDDIEIERIINFYDYLEVQPAENNEFMIRIDKYKAETIEDLRDYVRKIIEFGEIYSKPVVATCDVHFLDPKDEIYRRIIMAGKGFKDADLQPPLYFRTTEEMLKEFEYLGPTKAYEIVVENTHLINNKIEKISPVLPDKCPPEIENSDKELREICYTKAHEIYGENLPSIVVERLERELHSIISNGFAVMYIIAQKLVWDSNDHGYLVGSRGSVGSSFAATMAGITEVNPLSPHYICANCHYTDFDSPVVVSYAGSSGCDMPDANCPNCGDILLKEGHDIPFETFLGFKGDKEPDIDLNFSGDYQSQAHKYVEVLFGKGKAFRAGTIGTMAEKTALGYVYKYFSEKEIVKRKAEIKRIAQGCTGVKRTTGQHPGGIIVVPQDRDIYEFTAIQRPANDVKTSIITTHYEYHSIDHNLLKLDILGHDDPTIIKHLEDLTGITATTIKLDDKDVMSLFHSTKILKINPEDIFGVKLGCLGIPEFGTDFVIQMVIDAKPQTFSDLVRISGLSHGADVWIGNAQNIIAEGKATISTAICTRDDIMVYLINMGVDKSLSFNIMESVRKGKGLRPEWEEEMKKHDIPEWYIWSCNKISYMFPKAHAAAYVMMAWRIAWYKIFYPLAYYTAFFSIRASSFSYELMCLGKSKLEANMKELMLKGKDAQTPKESDTLKDMRIVQEMYARGFEFIG
ncbi:MAG: DNA polymerase III subunit alpha [Candidatus Epulonipiscium fishelsonii]|nr:MAG: DNA polymerase III subunit alpha [Epulopiscium sp. AS2M-Bin002]